MKKTNQVINCSKHAEKRLQQRGIKKEYVDILISFADREVPVRNGCVSLSVSKTKLKTLVKEGRLDAKAAEKIQNLALIEANDNGEIVTVLRPYADMRGQHHRKPIKLRRNRSKRKSRGAK